MKNEPFKYLKRAVGAGGTAGATGAVGGTARHMASAKNP